MSVKRNRPTDGGGNWMDTYGDMVTLLMTFFVMLYAMSNLNQQKWEVFVKSINPSSSKEEMEQIAINQPFGEGEYDVNGTMKSETEMPDGIDIDTLYLTLAQKMNENGVDGVTVSRGNDYTFVIFEDKAFFEGDSSVLTQQGQVTLDLFSETIEPARDTLSQINIMGHTAQGDPNKPNNPRTDRMLAAMRAAEVCIYIQSKNVIQPEKLVSISYGQFRPIDTYETREGRAKNRRVEILLIDNGASVRDLNEYYDEFNSGVNSDRTIVTDGIPVESGQGFTTTSPSSEGVSTTMSPVGGTAAATSGETETAQTGTEVTGAEEQTE